MAENPYLPQNPAMPDFDPDPLPEIDYKEAVRGTILETLKPHQIAIGNQIAKGSTRMKRVEEYPPLFTGGKTVDQIYSEEIAAKAFIQAQNMGKVQGQVIDTSQMFTPPGVSGQVEGPPVMPRRDDPKYQAKTRQLDPWVGAIALLFAANNPRFAGNILAVPFRAAMYGTQLDQEKLLQTYQADAEKWALEKEAWEVVQRERRAEQTKREAEVQQGLRGLEAQMEIAWKSGNATAWREAALEFNDYIDKHGLSYPKYTDTMIETLSETLTAESERAKREFDLKMRTGEAGLEVKQATAADKRASALLKEAQAGKTEAQEEFIRLQAEWLPLEKQAEVAERWKRIWKMQEDVRLAGERIAVARQKGNEKSITEQKGFINAQYGAMKTELEKQLREAKRVWESATMEYNSATDYGSRAVAHVKWQKAKAAYEAIEDQLFDLEADRQRDLGEVYQGGGGQSSAGSTGVFRKEGDKYVPVGGNPNPSGGTGNTQSRGFSRRFEGQVSRSQMQTAGLIRSRFRDTHGIQDERILQAILANAYAESGWNPKAVGDAGASFGLFQANTKGGMGAGHSPAKLKDPVYNIDLIAKSDVFKQFVRFANANPNMSARDLTYHFARIVERSAKKHLERRRGAWDVVFGGK